MGHTTTSTNMTGRGAGRGVGAFGRGGVSRRGGGGGGGGRGRGAPPRRVKVTSDTIDTPSYEENVALFKIIAYKGNGNFEAACVSSAPAHSDDAEHLRDMFERIPELRTGSIVLILPGTKKMRYAQRRGPDLVNGIVAAEIPTEYRLKGVREGALSGIICKIYDDAEVQVLVDVEYLSADCANEEDDIRFDANAGLAGAAGEGGAAGAPDEEIDMSTL